MSHTCSGDSMSIMSVRRPYRPSNFDKMRCPSPLPRCSGHTAKYHSQLNVLRGYTMVNPTNRPSLS